MKSKLLALSLVCAAPIAHAKTVAYLLSGSGGVQIEQSKGASLASGFTFDTGCTNEQSIIFIRTKTGKDVEWSYNVADVQAPGYAFANVIDETALTWTLYYESTDYGIPLSPINSGTLTKTKPC